MILLLDNHGSADPEMLKGSIGTTLPSSALWARAKKASGVGRSGGTAMTSFFPSVAVGHDPRH